MKHLRYITLLYLALVVCATLVSGNTKKKNINLKENRSVSLIAMVAHSWNPKKLSFKKAFRLVRKNCRKSLKRTHFFEKLRTISSIALQRANKSTKKSKKSRKSKGNKYLNAHGATILRLRNHFLKIVLKSFSCNVLPRSLRRALRRLVQVRLSHSSKHRKHSKKT